MRQYESSNVTAVYSHKPLHRASVHMWNASVSVSVSVWCPSWRNIVSQ